MIQCIKSQIEREKALALSKRLGRSDPDTRVQIMSEPTLKSKEPIDMGIIKPNPKKHLLQAKQTLCNLINKFIDLAGEDDEDYYAICSAANQINLALQDMEEK